jgi:hypothetical protein
MTSPQAPTDANFAYACSLTSLRTSEPEAASVLDPIAEEPDTVLLGHTLPRCTSRHAPRAARRGRHDQSACSPIVAYGAGLKISSALMARSAEPPTFCATRSCTLCPGGTRYTSTPCVLMKSPDVPIVLSRI